MPYQTEFQLLGIDAPYRTGGNIKVICPKCRDRKGAGLRDKDLSLNYDTGAFQCHSANCGWKGYAKAREYNRPEWRNKTNLPTDVVRYFESRGISQVTLSKMKVSTDDKNNIEFNYFKNNELVNIKTRFETPTGKTYKQHSGAEKLVYNFDSLKGKAKCIFVEGEMDVLSFVESGITDTYAVISVDNGAPADGQKTDGKLECLINSAEALDKIKEFYLCTDKDGPGEYLQKELIRRLGAHRCNIVSLPAGKKDANEVLDRRNGNLYSGDVCKETLRKCLTDAKLVPLAGIYTLDDDVFDEIYRVYKEGRIKGKTTHIKDLDELFTYLPGDITLVTGSPGDGKSQFVKQLALLKAKHDGWKWACYAPEDFPIDYFYEDLCHCYIGRTADIHYKYRMTEDELIEAMEFIRKHFFCIYPEADEETGEIPLPTNVWINQRINFLKLKYGVNAYMKDPWNKISHEFGGQREDIYLAQELSKEKFYAKVFDAALYIAHPHKMMKTKEGEYPCPTPYDVSGGAMWYNMMDNCLSIHRPTKWETGIKENVEVHTFKIKKTKLVGKLGSVIFDYDITANRYSISGKSGFEETEKFSQNGHQKQIAVELPF